LGAILALALFSIEAGVARIALARDEACRVRLATARVAPAAGAGCLSELELAATNALARGPAGILSRDDVTIATWFLSGVLYAALGGACAQLKLRRAIPLYLGIHVFVLVVAAFMLYIGPHVAV